LADVAFLQADILGLDPVARLLHLAGRPPLAFDGLSLDVGAITPAGPEAMAVKPLEPFLAWCAASPPAEPRLRGGGASAVEVALALRARGLRPQLVLRGSSLRLGSAAAHRLAERLLRQAAIPIHREQGAEARADLACSGSRAPQWLAAAGLPVDPASGRVLTAPTLEVLHHPGLFASGDCGLIASCPRPPSGVWAVRAAPVLAANLRRSLHDQPLRAWRPQRFALQLLGDGGVQGPPRALALWGPFAMGPSTWLWRWKHHLDQRFMAAFAELGTMAAGPVAMACRGCAAKLSAQPLRGALRQLAQRDGASPPPVAEDAPLVRQLEGHQRLLQSVDGFPALVADPWLNGRLTALHACSDLWASGATVESGQVVVTLPLAEPWIQQDLLLHTLAGVRSVLDPLGAALLGGHTLEGRDGAGLGVVLTVNGVAPACRHWAKGPLGPGDVLLLSRPLGTGVLFAAAMVGAATDDWIEGALAQMGQSQAPLPDLLAAHGCHACTDITGFGLLGHLGEMLADSRRQASNREAPSPVRVVLDGAAIPVLPGAMELLTRGHASSLAPANAEALAALNGPVRLEAGAAPSSALQGLLIDPQTCGPLLAALPADQAPAALVALHGAGFDQARVIARVIPGA
jgi:selenide,water dikinase